MIVLVFITCYDADDQKGVSILYATISGKGLQSKSFWASVMFVDIGCYS